MMAARVKSIEELNAKKNNYPLTKMLTDEQFSSLANHEKKFLMIQWDFPGESLVDVMGGTRAREYNLLSPPPNTFARSTDYKENFKSLSQWWKMGRQQQKTSIEWYCDQIGLEQKVTFQNNICSMIKDQLLNIVCIWKMPYFL